MPLVGKKHFSYTKAGYKAAALEAKRTGKPMTLSPNPSTKKTKAKKPKKKKKTYASSGVTTGRYSSNGKTHGIPEGESESYL